MRRLKLVTWRLVVCINRYAPKGLDKAQKAVAQWAAHLAVELPFECSPIDIVNTATKVSAGGLVEKK